MDALINGLSRAVDLGYINGDEAKAIARKQLGLVDDTPTTTEVGASTEPGANVAEQPAEAQPEATPEQPAQ